MCICGEQTFRPQQHAREFHSLISSLTHSVSEAVIEWLFISTCHVPGPMLVTKAAVHTCQIIRSLACRADRAEAGDAVRRVRVRLGVQRWHSIVCGGGLARAFGGGDN